MNRHWCCNLLRSVVILWALVVSAPAGHLYADTRPSARAAYVPGELLVRFRPGITPEALANSGQVGAASLQAVLQGYRITAIEQLFPNAVATSTGLERIYKLSMAPQADLLALLAALSGEQAVEYAEPNYFYYTQELATGDDLFPTASTVTRVSATPPLAITPSDRLFGQQWALYNPRPTNRATRMDIHAPEAWRMTTGASDLLIAVLDTGIDYTHEDLNDGRVRTDIDKDYVEKDDDALDDQGHGTHVAGTIAAASNNGTGVTGILWQAQLLPLKVCDETGACSLDAIGQAIEYAADHGARIISMSLGSDQCSATLEAAIDYAYFDKGVVVVAAAGNSNGLVGYPAAYDPVIAVGALDRHGQRAFFSNYGDALDLAAPGLRIFSTVPGNGYDTLSGTSMATPHVTGVAGLLLAQRPALTNHEVRAILQQSADDLGEQGLDRHYGYGLVNAQRALETVTPATAPAPGQSRCLEIECGAAAALEGEPDEAALLTTLRAVRDQLLPQQPGLRWQDIYYAHQTEVVWLVLADAQLRADARAAIRTLNPLLVALLNDRAANTRITAEMVAQTERVILTLSEHGSPALHDDLLVEWQRLEPAHFIGWTAGAAWAQLLADAPVDKLYLPLTM